MLRWLVIDPTSLYWLILALVVKIYKVWGCQKTLHLLFSWHQHHHFKLKPISTNLNGIFRAGIISTSVSENNTKILFEFLEDQVTSISNLEMDFIMKSSKRRHCELLNSSGSDGAVVLVVKSVRVQIHRPQTQRIITWKSEEAQVRTIH